jgi:hypothetical protein
MREGELAVSQTLMHIFFFTYYLFSMDQHCLKKTLGYTFECRQWSSDAIEAHVT